jgi:glycosyltransferase involved in cell wall biosynthesis
VIERDTVVGAAGELTEDSGAMFLLDVMHLLDQRDGCPHLVWIGDGPLRERFEQRAVELKLGNRVTVTGWVSKRADYMAALDCFCLPASRAGLPLALLEAMRLGMCCVANEVDGIGEALKTDRSGVLLPVGDQVGWANVLETVLEDQEFRTLLGEGALKAARARFSLIGMVSGIGAVYEGLLLEDALETDV